LLLKKKKKNIREGKGGGHPGTEGKWLRKTEKYGRREKIGNFASMDKCAGRVRKKAKEDVTEVPLRPTNRKKPHIKYGGKRKGWKHPMWPWATDVDLYRLSRRKGGDHELIGLLRRKSHLTRPRNQVGAADFPIGGGRGERTGCSRGCVKKCGKSITVKEGLVKKERPKGGETKRHKKNRAVDMKSTRHRA